MAHFFPKIVLCPSTQPSPGTMPYFSKSWPSDTSNPFIRGSVHLWFLDYHMKGKSSKGGREKLPKKYSPLNKSHPSLCLIPKKKHRHWTKSGSRGGYGETYSLKVLAHGGLLFDFQTINPIILDFEMSLHKESSEPLWESLAWWPFHLQVWPSGMWLLFIWWSLQEHHHMMTKALPREHGFKRSTGLPTPWDTKS